MIGGLVVSALLAGSAASASAIDVATFLAKAEALQKRGPLAFFSNDYRMLKGAAEKAGAELKAERLAIVRAGKPAPYCPPDAAKLGSSELLGALRAIPDMQRPATSLKAAMRAHFVRKWPCSR